MKVCAIMKLCELQNDFNGFRLIWAWETSMFFAVENSFTAFVNQMWADWILRLIQSLVEGLLLWQQDDRSEVWQLPRSSVTIFLDSPLDVIPHIRRVIPVEEDYCLREILNSFEVDTAIGMLIHNTLLLNQLLHQLSLACFWSLSIWRHAIVGNLI